MILRTNENKNVREMKVTEILGHRKHQGHITGQLEMGQKR